MSKVETTQPNQPSLQQDAASSPYAMLYSDAHLGCARVMRVRSMLTLSIVAPRTPRARGPRGQFLRKVIHSNVRGLANREI